jgi:hypothetical protein
LGLGQRVLFAFNGDCLQGGQLWKVLLFGHVLLSGLLNYFLLINLISFFLFSLFLILPILVICLFLYLPSPSFIIFLFMLILWLVALIAILDVVHISNLLLLLFLGVYLIINQIASAPYLFQHEGGNFVFINLLTVDGYLFVIAQFGDHGLPLFLGNLGLTRLDRFEEDCRLAVLLWSRDKHKSNCFFTIETLFAHFNNANIIYTRIVL